MKFQYIWKRDTSVAKAVYCLEDIEKGCAKAPRSRDGSRMTDWELVARRQFTGKVDKNGVEIFEGTVCVNESGRIAVCNYHEGSASFDFTAIHSEGSSAGYKPQLWRYALEVIGNIYENPELLNDR